MQRHYVARDASLPANKLPAKKKRPPTIFEGLSGGCALLIFAFYERATEGAALLLVTRFVPTIEDTDHAKRIQIIFNFLLRNFCMATCH